MQSNTQILPAALHQVNNNFGKYRPKMDAKKLRRVSGPVYLVLRPHLYTVLDDVLIAWIVSLINAESNIQVSFFDRNLHF